MSGIAPAAPADVALDEFEASAFGLVESYLARFAPDADVWVPQLLAQAGRDASHFQ